jgi:membrane protease YdiL (CAAX protease family)
MENPAYFGGVMDANHNRVGREYRIRRNYGLFALATIVLSKLFASLLLASRRMYSFDLDLSLNLHSLLFYWLAPILLAAVVERRSLATLGMQFGRGNAWVYALLAAAGMVVVFLVRGFSRNVFAQLYEQIAFIAVPEEILWRGYLQVRLSDWLGSIWGLGLAAFLFGLGHVISLFAAEGSLHLLSALSLMLQTTLGGVVLGLLYRWSRSLIPGAFLHLLGNVLLS